MSTLPFFEYRREFKASASILWNIWTKENLLKRWYGPDCETFLRSYELRPRGVWLTEMRTQEHTSFQKAIFESIIENEKIEWYQFGAVNAQGECIENSMLPDWPDVLHSTVLFVQKSNEQTFLELKQIPYEATEKQIASFTYWMPQVMQNAWEHGYAEIDRMIEEGVVDSLQGL